MRPDAREASALVHRFGTPLYVYDLAAVERAYGRFLDAFPYRPLRLHYAIVCNKNPVVVRRLVALGAGIHANTPGDAHAALATGVPASRIVYSGTNLNAVDLDYFLDRGIYMNLDSLDQLRDFAERRPGRGVGLRLLVDDPYGRPNRIGVTAEELPEAVSIGRAGGHRITGLHMYAGTNTRRFDRFLQCLDRLIEATDLLEDLEHLDIGGGFGMVYREAQLPLDIEKLGSEVTARVIELSMRRSRPIRLLAEPGRILVGRAGTLLATVVSVKVRGGRRFVGVDTTVGNIVVPSVYHAHHRIEALHPRGDPLPVPTDVCGNTTHSRDYLGCNLRLPELRPGDLIALRDVGAYGYAMSSHFLNRPRPAEVVLNGFRAVLTTRREALDDLLSLHVGVLR